MFSRYTLWGNQFTLGQYISLIREAKPSSKPYIYTHTEEIKLNVPQSMATSNAIV